MHFETLREESCRWIQEVHIWDPEQYYIICCNQAQAKLFQSARCLQIDTSFKAIHGKANIMTCSSWLREHECK
jgi:hypothetical protein